MFFAAHPILTARWLARIMLVIIALALFNFSAGVSVTRTRQSAAVHHLQLFGGLMPIHVESTTHQHATPVSQITVVSTQGDNSEQTTSFGFGSKISQPATSILILPRQTFSLSIFTATLPTQPYLTLPPKPPQI